MLKRFSILLFTVVTLCSCEEHFISDTAFREAVVSDFNSRVDILEKAGVSLENMELAVDEKEALEFLYAYMPLGDMVNMSQEYWLENYRMTREAMKTMPWGGIVPERELRHFVLPVRVNNENLDTSRAVFFGELAPRVKKLSMYDAVLEVNHWCHEKAVYQPTDSRTCSPLSIIKTAYGRCGEESTFLVAALRSVGIPARQVYTPRWAHTDDNHAWVEAWADGKWYFLGACEPEPVLNLGWFNAPASRGMLMHTKVFGKYDGPEEVVKVTPGYTEINVIENYSPEAAKLQVFVKDSSGSPVPGARVEFRLYNYAEFYPVAVKTADKDGKSFLTAGFGDMMIYASDGKAFGIRKVTFGKEKSVEIILDNHPGDNMEHMSLEVVPPIGRANIPAVTQEQRDENTRRMAEEDSIRLAYVSTFYDYKKALKFAEELGLPEKRVARILVESRGNYAEIIDFLKSAAESGRTKDALSLLEVISEKDLHDTPCEVLADHLANTPEGADAEKILSPRVAAELLTAYRSALKSKIPESLAESFRNDPSLLVHWCKENLRLLDEISMPYVQVAPEKVWETCLADRSSRETFFVAVCRTLGIPAWKDSVTGTLKYESAGKIYDVDFDSVEQKVSPVGKLKLSYDEIPLLDDPKYYIHFTLSKWDNGTFRLLNYPDSATWKAEFRRGTELECGYYMLVSGARMSGGNVLADVRFFTVSEGETVEVPLTIRDDASQIRVIGSFNSEALYDKVSVPGKDYKVGERGSVLSTTGRGYFTVILADYGHEPTNHALKDLSKVAEEMEQWGRPVLVIFASENDCKRFRTADFSLPSTVSYGIDTDGSIREMIAGEMKLGGKGQLPLVVLADTFNRVVLFSEGYTIGLGDRIVKTVKML